MSPWPRFFQYQFQKEVYEVFENVGVSLSENLLGELLEIRLP